MLPGYAWRHCGRALRRRHHLATRHYRRDRTIDGGEIVGIPRHWAIAKHLIWQDLAVKDVASGDADDSLDIRGAQHLHVFDGLRQIGRVVRERGDNGCADLVAALVPAPVGQIIRCVLHEGAQRMAAIGRESGTLLSGSLDIDVHEGMGRRFALFAVVPGVLQILDGGIDHDNAAQCAAHRVRFRAWR